VRQRDAAATAATAADEAKKEKKCDVSADTALSPRKAAFSCTACAFVAAPGVSHPAVKNGTAPCLVCVPCHYARHLGPNAVPLISYYGRRESHQAFDLGAVFMGRVAGGGGGGGTIDPSATPEYATCSTTKIVAPPPRMPPPRSAIDLQVCGCRADVLFGVSCARDAAIACGDCHVAYCRECDQGAHGLGGPGARHRGIPCMTRNSGFLSAELAEYVENCKIHP
jgi:hypothetical protein